MSVSVSQALHEPVWFFVKVFPPFMLPPFYLGAAACDLYQQQLTLDSKVGSESTDADGEHVWGAIRGYSTVIGEILFLAWVGVQWVPYSFFGVAESHIWSLVFGSVLFFFALSSADLARTRGGQLQVGAKWLLASEYVVMLGDASLCAFTFQFPVAKVYYWGAQSYASASQRKSSLWIDNTQVGDARAENIMAKDGAHWMEPYEFGAFIVVLYCLSIYFGRYIDKPMSAWIQAKLIAATA